MANSNFQPISQVQKSTNDLKIEDYITHNDIQKCEKRKRKSKKQSELNSLIAITWDNIHNNKTIAQ